MKKRIKASSLQWKGYDYICEELENCEDTADLLDEYGTRLADGTIDNDDSSYDADDYHGLRVKSLGELKNDKQNNDKNN